MRFFRISKTNVDSLLKQNRHIFSHTPRVVTACTPSDLLDMMLSVRYEDGSSMPDKQVRDEAMTFVLAGHESTAAIRGI